MDVRDELEIRDERMKVQSIITGCIAFTLIAIGIAVLLSGCSVTPAARYKPGENFGNGGATRCNTIQTHTSRLPKCK